MNDTTAAPQLADGIYTWRAVSPYGAGQDMSATVAAGRVTAWEYVNADGTTAPAAWPYQLERSNADFMAALAHEVSEAKRLKGLIHPVEFTPAQSATLGNQRAHKLHKVMARLGMAHAEHYRFAAQVLAADVSSLAALTEMQARRVWGALVTQYPQARTLAA